MPPLSPDAATRLSSHRIGTCAALASALVFACMNLVVLGAAGRLGAAACLASRGLVGTVLLTPLVWREAKQVLSRQGWALWTQCIFGALASLALFYNVTVSSVGEAVALSYMAPIVVALVGPVVFRERLALQQAAGVLVMVGGAFCLQLAHAPWHLSWGTSVGLCGALCGGVSLLALKRAAQQHSPWLAAWTFCLFSIFTALVVDAPGLVLQLGDAWGAALAVGCLGCAGQVGLSWSFKRLPAALAGALSLTTLIFSVVFEGIYTARWPGALQGIGYALMCLGLLVLQSSPRRAAARPGRMTVGL